MRVQTAAVLSALIIAASAAAQTYEPLRLPASPRSVYVAPTPTPVAPPTNAAPAPAPCRRRLSHPPGRCPGPPFVGVIERPDLRVTEQPSGLLDRHPVIRQITSGKALSKPF
jgi:hypothetical protein